MFKLFISLNNDKCAITKYMKEKNIKYEIFNHNNNINNYKDSYQMIDGKINPDATNNIMSEWMLFICCYNLVTIAKFCTKNKLIVEFSDIWTSEYTLLKKKFFEDFSYLHKHKFFSNNEISRFLQCACIDSDSEVVDYLLDFGIDVKHFGMMIENVSIRDDLNQDSMDTRTQIAKSLLNYCRKKYSRRLYSFPTCPTGQGKCNNYDKNTYNDELMYCAGTVICSGNYDMVKLLIDYGLDSSMDEDFVSCAYGCGFIDICDLLLYNGFKFHFRKWMIKCIIDDNKMINERIDFIYHNYIDKYNMNPPLVFWEWIDENKIYTNVSDESSDDSSDDTQRLMSGEEFLTVVFTKILISATFANKINVIKTVIATDLDFRPTVKNLSHNHKVDNNVCSYFKSILKNNNVD